MKKIILSLLIVLFTIGVNAQKQSSTTYSIYKSEIYMYEDGKWTLEHQNLDVDIDMVFYNDAINIQAKTPTLFKLKTATKKSFKGDGYYGISFEALECVEGKACTVDYVYETDNTNSFMLSVTYKKNGENVNLRYYSTLHNN